MTVAEIKTDLRIGHNKLDADLQSTLDACLLDLKMAGVASTATDALIGQAQRLYCRWQFDYCNKADQYEKAYTALKQALSLCGDYNGGGAIV